MDDDDSLKEVVLNGYATNLSDEDGNVDIIPMEMDLTTNGPPPPDDDDSDRKELRETCGSKTYKYAKIFLPHIGLVLLLGVYTVCGAGIFHIMELPHEIKVRNETLYEIKRETAEILDKLWNMTLEEDVDKVKWLLKANDELRDLKRILYDAYEDKYISFEDIQNDQNGNATRPNMWTIPQAIFFATTVITTIGYGNMVPKTTSGKILCIVFGLFGIPLLLITIADIGKFLSDLMKYLYRSYRTCKNQLRKQSRKLSTFRRKSLGLPPVPLKKKKDKSNDKDDEMRLPWIMVMLVLITYTALGALLFHTWEKWEYFDAFYFCFITMVTVGFGDIVPKQQTYMFFTIAYILVGLALTTMCIDLAGTQYIAKIHYFGQKIDTAKGAIGGVMVSGLHAGEQLLKHTGYGFIKTTGGKIVQISVRQRNNAMTGEFDFEDALPDGMTESEYNSLNPERSSRRRHGLMNPLHRNILYAPLSPGVQKILKPHIKIRLDEIKESDAFILENKTFNVPLDQQQRQVGLSKEAIKHRLRSQTWPRKYSDSVLLVAPFLLKESKC